MRNTRYGLVFLIVFSVLTFGLTTPGNAVTGPTLTIQANSGLTSLNTYTVNGYSPIDAQIDYLWRSGFFNVGQNGEQIANTTFGSATIVSKYPHVPFKVRYTINKGRVWSDGVPITAADLLVHHITCSSKYSVVANLGSPSDTSKAPEFKSNCYGGDYDQRVVAIPTVSLDKLSITVEFDKFFPGWAQASPMPFPAHALVLISEGRNSLSDIAKAEAAKAVFEKAVTGYDRNALLTYAKTWSSGYNLTDISKETNPLLLVSNGGYLVESAVANKSVSLVYNEKYNSGPRVQGIARINYRVIADGNLASQALANQEIDLLEVLPTADTLASFRKLANVKVVNYGAGVYEHLDLRVSTGRSGGEPYSGIFAGNSSRAQELRRAFLLAFPREEIVEKLIVPISPQAKPLDSLLFSMEEATYSTAISKNGISTFAKDSQSVREAQALAIVKKYFPSASNVNPQAKVNLLWGSPANSRRQNMVKLATTSLARAGFDVTAPGVTSWPSELGSSKNDASIFAWARSDISTERNLNYYCSLCGNNYMGYSDDLLDDSLSTIQNDNLSENARFNRFITAENQIYKNAWSLPLFQLPAAYATNSSLGNFKPGANSLPGLWNYWELTLPGAKPFELFSVPSNSTKPTNLSFSGINFVGNKVNLTVNIGSSAANRPDKIYLVSPKLGVRATNPLAGKISGNVATWSLGFNKSLSGLLIPFEIVSEKNGVKSDPLSASYQAPILADATSSVPPTPTKFKFLIVGNSAVITAELAIKPSALATNAYLVSSDLGFTSARPLKGEVAGSKIIAEIDLKPSMVGKNYPVSIYVTNSKGKSKSLEGMISIPKSSSTPKNPTGAPSTLICVNKFNPNRTTTTEGTSCPVGWQEL